VIDHIQQVTDSDIDAKFFTDLTLEGSPQGMFSPTDFGAYRQAWQQDGSLNAMLNWYRALLFRPVRLPAHPRLHMPVLLMWGGRDFALGVELAEASIKLCPNGRRNIFPEANHWLQHEEVAEVSRHLVEFLKPQPDPEQ